MIELPEAATLAAQLNEAVRGQRVSAAIAGHSPHKFAWFHGDPAGYGALLSGRNIGSATSHGGFVEIDLDGVELVLAEGVGLRLHGVGEPRPAKHQLFIELADGRTLTGTVQMYGGFYAFRTGAFDNPYLAAARAKPSPLADAFDAAHFAGLLEAPGAEKLSLKALLATEQRIPGLGNGVLQDILFAAGLHPRRKVLDLSPVQRDALYAAVKDTLAQMTAQGGRDTERDLYGQPGGYRTRLSRNTVGQPCPRCGGTIRKEPYLGGAVYWCCGCQAVVSSQMEMLPRGP
jgi:formamidopyrimidine-DNA glycosylase